MKKMFLLGGMANLIIWSILMFAYLGDFEMTHNLTFTLLVIGAMCFAANMSLITNKDMWKSLSELQKETENHRRGVRESNVAVDILKDAALRKNLITREFLREEMTKELGYEWEPREKL